MRRGIVLVGLACALLPRGSAAQPAPPLPWDPEPPPPLFVGRLELDYGFLSPRGALVDAVDGTNAVRVRLGVNFTRMLSMSFGTRLSFITEDLSGMEFYYFDLLTMGLRFGYDTGHRITPYLDGEASLTGISVPCDPDEALFDECTTTNLERTFLPRLGLHWRAGINFQVTPGRFEVGVSVGQTTTIPDEGGWFEFAGGLVLHWGNPHPSSVRRAPPTGYPEPMRRRGGYDQ